MARLLAGKQPEITQVPEGDTEDERLAALVDAISSYREGDTVKVVLGGACVGCPITPATLCGWVLGTVQQFFPEIQRIEAIETPMDGE
jgi:dienelactone hydrolase